MKRIYFLVLFALVGVAIAPAWGQEKNRKEERSSSTPLRRQTQRKVEDPYSPMQLIGTNTVQLGKISGFDSKHVVFVFTNTSQTQVHLISLKPTCGCVRGEPNKNTISPGDTVAVTFHFSPYSIHGTFQRGLWASFSEPSAKRFYLAVSGEVRPLFEGMPSEPISLQSADLCIVWTNHYLLTPTEAGIHLGAPEVDSNVNLRVEASLAAATNAVGAAAYAVSVVVAPLAIGRHNAHVALPVVGRPDMPALALDLAVHAGLSLSAKPDQVMLYETETPVMRRILMRTDDPTAVPELLTWEPTIEGLTVNIKKMKMKSVFMVTLEFTPAAVKRLREGKESRLLFRYARHEPVEVRVTPANRPNE